MILYDDIFTWEGWGGRLKLANGRCRLRIFDLRQARRDGVLPLRSFVVVASDLPREGMLKGEVTVRSASSHIATVVCRRFQIDPQRMQFVEYTPAERYGKRGEYEIAAAFDAVEFTWREGLALFPRIKPLGPPLRDIVEQLVTRPEKPAD